MHNEAIGFEEIGGQFEVDGLVLNEKNDCFGSCHKFPRVATEWSGRRTRRSVCPSGFLFKTGRENAKVLPLPSMPSLEMVMRPPCISTRRLVSASPRPVPCCWRPYDESTCSNSLKMRS